MKILSAVIENFYSIGRIEIDLSQYSGSALAILGDNRDSDSQDSNGSGKSAIIEAIIWCMFGKLLRPALVSDITRAGMKLCNVEVVTDICTLKRSRIGKKTSAWIDGQGCNANDLTAFVESKLGVGFHEFVASSVFCQAGSVVPFLRMSDSDRKQVIEHMRSLTQFSGARKCAASIAKDSHTRLSAHEKSVEELETVLKGIQASSENDLAALKQSLEQENEKCAAIKKTLIDEGAKLETVESEFKKVSAAKIQWNNDQAASISDMTDRHIADEKNWSSIYADQSGSESKLRLLEMDLQESQALVDRGVCPTCKADVTSGKVGKNLIQTIKALQANVLEAKKMLALKTLALNVAIGVKEGSGDVLAKLRAKELPEDIATEYNELSGKRATTAQQLSAIEAEKAAIEATIRSLRQQVRDASTSRQSEIEELEISILAHKRSIETLSECEKHSMAVTEALSPSGVRSWLMDSVCGTISRYATEALRLVSDASSFIHLSVGRNADGTPSERVVVSTKLSESVDPRTSQSPGELRLADICVQIGLHRYLCNDILNIDGFGVMVFDDVLDVLDATAATAVVRVIQQYAEQTGDCVLIASPDMLPVGGTSVITVVKEDGVSKI